MRRTLRWNARCSGRTNRCGISRHRADACGALNEAIAGIAKEQVRLHCCWGNWEGPHVHDVPLSEILTVLYGANTGALSVEFANPRHQHELSAFKTHPFPDGKVLIRRAGLTTTMSASEVVANRINTLPSGNGCVLNADSSC